MKNIRLCHSTKIIQVKITNFSSRYLVVEIIFLVASLYPSRPKCMIDAQVTAIEPEKNTNYNYNW
jgi:hypothetical protein